MTIGQSVVTVEDPSPFAVGDEVLLVRPATPAWLARLGMDRLSTGAPDPDGVVRGQDWTPEEATLRFLRRIAAVDGDAVTLDAPAVMPMEAEAETPAGYLVKFTAPGQIREVGIEHLRLETAFDPAVTAVEPLTGEVYASDEAKAKTGVLLKNVRDAWVRGCTFLHFSGSAVAVAQEAAFLTIEDCLSLEPVSRITGSRRYSFAVGGQRVLVTRCYADRGRHDFTLTRWAAGPNVFFDNSADRSYSFLEPHGQMNPGVLFDNVVTDGGPRNAITTLNRGTSGKNHGWTGVGVAWWNCDAPAKVVASPPDGPNFVVGDPGLIEPAPATAEHVRDWASYRSGMPPMPIDPAHPALVFDERTVVRAIGRPATPRSLYLAQLGARLGVEAVERATTPAQRERLAAEAFTAFRPARVAAARTHAPRPGAVAGDAPEENE